MIVCHSEIKKGDEYYQYLGTQALTKNLNSYLGAYI